MTDRTCGACNACCVVLWIGEPLDKPAGLPCANLVQIGSLTNVLERAPLGCGIYDSRPEVCRAFKCLWLDNPPPKGLEHMTLRDDERPDLCGVMVGATSLDSHFFRETGVPMMAAYETRPGGSDTYHAQRLLKRLARRTLVAIVPFDALTKDPRRFIGPASLVHKAKLFAQKVGAKGTIR